MKFFKILWIVIVLFITYIISLKCIINNNNIFAHEENIGIEGYSGIEFDECEPYGATTTGTTSSYGEKWYLLHSVYENVDSMIHIDDDIETVYYRFYNKGSKTNETWLDNYEYYKVIASLGFDKWNYVAAYKEDSNGILQVIPIIKIINVDTLDNPDEIEEHIEVHIYDDTDMSILGNVEFALDSEVLEDTKYYNGIKHAHYTKCIINLYPAKYKNTVGAIEVIGQTATHEMGHVLGLEDIDFIENDNINLAHHQELLMGYSNEYENASNEISYRDLAGVLITRGIHTNDDHKWLLDSASSTDNYKLICSLCNCVKYVDSLEGIEYEVYKSCNDNHDLESGNMMPVARYLERDYWKCRYCRQTYHFNSNVLQKYMYIGIYNENTHTVKNNVLGLEYIVEEEHDYMIDLGDGRLKCSFCPVCNDGSIHVVYDEEIQMECIMNEFSDSNIYLENDTKLYKLDVKCKSNYHIQARGVNKVKLELFDSNLNLINRTFTVSSNNIDTFFDGILQKGTYYLRARYDDFTNTGEIVLNVSSNNDFYQTPIDYLDDANVLNHMHDSHNEFIYNDNFDRIVEIKLNVTSTEELNLPEGAISVTDKNGNIISKFYNSITDLAYSKEGQNSIIVYLSKNTDYIININLDIENLNFAILSIDMIHSFTFDSFKNDNHTFIDADYSLGDYILRAYPTQHGKYGIKLTYDGDELCDANMVIITETIGENYQPTYTIEYSDLSIYDSGFDAASKEFTYNPNKTYYVGVFGGNILEHIKVEFYRKIKNTQNLIVTDPSSGYECGSEVTLNNGLYLGDTLTEGYTRCLFFENGAPSNSRLDYYWYSSNEDILDVSIYGTVLAYNVNMDMQVCINAVYKYDTSIVYQIYLTVKDEEITTPKYLEYDIDLRVGDIYQIEADSRWPSTTLQNFTWTSSDSSLALVSIWGTIRPQAVGNVIIQGHYLLNERYYIILRINIT